MARDLFLFAHPDDDLFMRPLIARSHHAGGALVFYLTNGAAGGKGDPARRRAESTAALKAQGLAQSDIAFVGHHADIPDGILVQHLETAFQGAMNAIADAQIAAVYTHAWEGGHQDHDSAHLIALAVAAACGAPAWQGCYYRKPKSGPLPFITLQPLSENGLVERRGLTFAEAASMFTGYWHYPSQAIPLLGLTPPTLAALALSRSIPLQKCSPGRAWERPTAAPLLYEARGGPAYAEFAKISADFIANRIAKAP